MVPPLPTWRKAGIRRLVKRTGGNVAARYDDMLSGAQELEVLNYTPAVRILRLFRPYRGRLGTVLGLIGISALLGVASPFLLRAILDDAIPNNNTTQLALLVAGVVAVLVAAGALGVAQAVRVH